jgi:SAM-dependent methyltransferase
MASVSRVHVDNDGIFAATRSEVVLDVLFDGRRIWSFWLIRDGVERDGGYAVAWPPALQRFLRGTTTLALVEHVSGTTVFEQEVTLGSAPAGTRIAVVNADGKPLGLDKSNRLAQTFDTRSEEHVAPLLDSIEEVLQALRKAGIEAFPAYGTLLGAVRGGKLIGHDSDADLGYVSDHTHPVDVVRESFQIQRRLADMGYRISRYSGAAFKVDVIEADGSVRGLDVFGGFLHDGNLVLMGEIRTPFEREWIFPLGTTTLEGRTLPAPADTDRFLAATYGPSWRVPDPAFHFGTPRSTHRRLNGWFRGTRIKREEWDRIYSSAHRRRRLPQIKPSRLARWAREWEPELAEVVDVGTGRGVDAYWFAAQGVPAIGLDYSPRGAERLAEQARETGLPATYHMFNLLELRQVLGWGARLAHASPAGPRAVLARHVADATDAVGRRHLWRFAQMALAGGGRLYLEFLAPEQEGERPLGAPYARRRHLHPLSPELVISELEARGATVVAREDKTLGRRRRPGTQQARPRAGRRRICRLVVEWQA